MRAMSNRGFGVRDTAVRVTSRRGLPTPEGNEQLVGITKEGLIPLDTSIVPESDVSSGRNGQVVGHVWARSHARRSWHGV